MNFNKIVRLGHIGANIFCRIKFENGNLSIVGVEGPTPDGNALCCGQIDSYLRERLDRITPAPGWTREMLERFLGVWDEWHLNNMQAGSPAQRAWLKLNPITDRLNYYTKAGEALAAAGLNPDPNYLHQGKPYRYGYGHAWLRTEVPQDVLYFLQALPDTDTQPAWV